MGEGGSSAETVVASWHPCHPSHLILLLHEIGSLLLACACGWVKNTEGIDKAHDRK